MALQDAYQRIERLKAQASDAPDDTLAGTALAGALWLAALINRHGVDVDEIQTIDERLADVTVARVLELNQRQELDAATALRAVHAGGFTNGLAIGLEHAREVPEPEPPTMMRNEAEPFAGHRVTGLWALVYLRADGSEGLVGLGPKGAMSAAVASSLEAAEHLRAAARDMRDQLRPGDRIVLRTFHQTDLVADEDLTA